MACARMIALLRLLLRGYQAWGLRPHCRPGRHVLACRVTGPLQDTVKERCWYWQRDHQPLVGRSR